MSDLALKNRLYLELEKASPAVLHQLFEFLLFLKRAELNVPKTALRKTRSKNTSAAWLELMGMPLRLLLKRHVSSDASLKLG